MCYADVGAERGHERSLRDVRHGHGIHHDPVRYGLHAVSDAGPGIGIS